MSRSNRSSRSSSKRKRNSAAWCVLLVALVGTACLLYGIIALMWPELTEPADLTDKSQPYVSSAVSEVSKVPPSSGGASSTEESSFRGFVSVSMKVPVILQDGLPTGCEATAAAMLLQAYGYDVTKEEMARAYPLTQQETVNGRRYAAHPEKAFLGDPFTQSGFGIFSPAMVSIMQEAVDSRGGGHRVVDLKGSSEEEILAYIRSGTPVCIWSTMRGADVVNQYSWYIKEGDTYTDQLFVWPGNEHCLVLTGYDEDTVTVNDPQSGETQYDRADFFRHYREIGRYALVISE